MIEHELITSEQRLRDLLREGCAIFVTIDSPKYPSRPLKVADVIDGYLLVESSWGDDRYTIRIGHPRIIVLETYRETPTQMKLGEGPMITWRNAW